MSLRTSAGIPQDRTPPFRRYPRQFLASAEVAADAAAYSSVGIYLPFDDGALIASLIGEPGDAIVVDWIRVQNRDAANAVVVRLAPIFDWPNTHNDVGFVTLSSSGALDLDQVETVTFRLPVLVAGRATDASVHTGVAGADDSLYIEQVPAAGVITIPGPFTIRRATGITPTVLAVYLTTLNRALRVVVGGRYFRSA